MKNKKIIGLIILFLFLILGIGLFMIYHHSGSESISNTETQNEEGDIIYNTSQGITEEKNINHIIFTDIECSYDGFYSLLTYKIINQTSETVRLDEYEIIVKDKDNNILANISPNIVEELAPGEEIETGNAIDIDLSDATSMELVIEE